MTIFLVEDSPGDVRLVREALVEGEISHVLVVARDGIEAMDYLNRATRRPDLILLDLNLPRKDGREVLADIKRDPELRRIPVVILSTSRSAEDVRQTYESHANCYIAKPPDFEEFIAIVKTIEEFWLRAAQLPPP